MTSDPRPEGRYLLDFSTSDLPRLETDVLVVGGGIAGLSAALAAAEGARVLVVCKDDPDVCNTAWAQGGIAAALGSGDSPRDHAADTLRTACGLADPAVVEAVTGAAPEAVRQLAAEGAHFDTTNGSFALGREGGHGQRRVLHRGDATGLEIIHALQGAVRRTRAVHSLDRRFLVDLLTEDGRCRGALLLDRRGQLAFVAARAVVMAAGGAGRLWRETSNVRGATGDGVAAAYRAGATVRDVEFMQFHPTTLYLAGTDRILVTEAVRGEGAHLIDDTGHRFLKHVHEAAELAPRDIVSRAIVDHLAQPGVQGVFLDLRHWDPAEGRARFPGLYATCERYGLDPAHNPIPVRPAAHYFIGGIACDPDGATDLPGLFACGEASNSGMHGANRLASNSLLEGLVLGAAAGRAAQGAGSAPTELRIRHATGRTRPEAHLDVEDLRDSLASIMWRHVGVLREAEGLGEAGEAIRQWRFFCSRVKLRRRGALELENLLLLGGLVTEAARRREESRGTHSRSDFPERDDARFRGSFCWQRGEEPRFRRLEDPPLG